MPLSPLIRSLLAAALSLAYGQFDGKDFDFSLDDKPKKPRPEQPLERPGKTAPAAPETSQPKAKRFRPVELKGYFTAEIPPWSWEFLPSHGLLGEGVAREVHDESRWSVEYLREGRRTAKEDANGITVEPDALPKERKRGISLSDAGKDCRAKEGTWEARLSIVYHPDRGCTLLRLEAEAHPEPARADACRPEGPKLPFRTQRKCVAAGKGAYEILYRATASVFDAKLAYLKPTYDSFKPDLADKPAPAPAIAARRELVSPAAGQNGAAKAPEAGVKEEDKEAERVKQLVHEQSNQALIKSIQRDANMLVRSFAALELGNRGPDAATAVMALIAALRDKEFSVRMSAAWALGRIGAPARKAIPALRRAADDPNPDVRQAAETALTRLES